jgi:pimeloyl-ACP methyl ester carboxylesterase
MPLFLLHGAIGSSQQLKPLQAELIKSGFDTKLFDFCGHGGREIPATPFSISLFADELVNWMDDHRMGEIDIFGYSMGGYVALYMAKHYPERVGKILTLATKLAWDVPTAEKEVKMLNPEKIAEKVPKFAEALQQRHAPADWKVVLNKTAEMMLAMGAVPPLKDEDFRAITHKVQLCVGDRDNMVSESETRNVHHLITGSVFYLLPETPHPVEQMEIAKLRQLAENFFQG